MYGSDTRTYIFIERLSSAEDKCCISLDAHKYLFTSGNQRTHTHTSNAKRMK